MKKIGKFRSAMRVLTGKAIAVDPRNGSNIKELNISNNPLYFDEPEPLNQGIYMDVVKRPVRHRPRPLAEIKAESKRIARNAQSRAKRAAKRKGEKGKLVGVNVTSVKKIKLVN